MKWTVTVTGQPPTLNHSYRNVLRTSASGKSYTGRAKETAVAAYQTGAVMEVRTAKPSHWRHGGGLIRISYSFRLSRAVDCDNAMKALNDAVALAIGVDDRFFLPCVIWKTIDKRERSPGVDLTIEDLSGLPSPLPTPSPR